MKLLNNAQYIAKGNGNRNSSVSQDPNSVGKLVYNNTPVLYTKKKKIVKINLNKCIFISFVGKLDSICIYPVRLFLIFCLIFEPNRSPRMKSAA